jgi:hypothetical protein
MAVAVVVVAVGGVRVGVAESDAFRVVGPRRSWEVGSCSCHLFVGLLDKDWSVEGEEEGIRDFEGEEGAEEGVTGERCERDEDEEGQRRCG